MSTDRMLRINALIRQEVASFLYREINEPDFDMSAVTVTDVFTSTNLRQAKVMVSIRAEPAKQHEMLQRLRHHRTAIQKHIGKTVVIKYTPQLSFELDQSIAKGDHVLHVISELEAEHPEWPDTRIDEPGPKKTP
jgi:ribosome-binding factor A